MGILLLLLKLLGYGSLFGILCSVPLMASLLLLGSSIGLLVAPLGLLYEDIGQGIGLCLQLMFFLIPIVYPPPMAGAGLLLVEWNPVAVLLVSAREMTLTGNVTFFWESFIAALTSVGITIVAFLFLRLARPHLAERLG